MYTCAKCGVHVCCTEDQEKLPKNCPIRQEELKEESFGGYQAEEFRKFYITSSQIESMGYCQWVRLRETIEFCGHMGYKKIGLAFCSGLRKEARVVAEVLEKHGFEVVSVICKAGGIDKCRAGILDQDKLRPGSFEAMCNPIFQAGLLNSQKTEFNLVLGLCVGHDSLFYRHSEALVTTLVVKDRVLAHNPVGAIYGVDGYFKEKL